MVPRQTILASLLAVSACGQFGDNATTAAELDSEITQAEEELGAHTERCMSADEMEAMMEELGRHEGAMEGIMDRMHRSVGDLDHCGHHGEMNGMGEHMSDLDERMAMHGTRLRQAKDVSAGHAECEEHHAGLSKALAGVRGGLSSMDCMHGGMR